VNVAFSENRLPERKIHIEKPRRGWEEILKWGMSVWIG
jgi:hypothetical protein